MDEVISLVIDRLAEFHQQCNAAELIKAVLPEFENKPPGMNVQDMPDSIACEVDPEQMKTVLRNVLNNAFKYSPEDSEPSIVSLSKKPSYAVICVEDNGIGIPDEHLPFIFEPFFRTDKSRSKKTGGYGLGLSLCKTIMEAHGGRIEIESVPNEGTRGCLYIPVSDN